MDANRSSWGASVGLVLATVLAACSANEPNDVQLFDGEELSVSAGAEALVSVIADQYRYPYPMSDDPSDFFDLAGGPVLQPAPARRFIWDGSALRAELPFALVDVAPFATNVRIGLRASDPFEVADVASGLKVRARMLGVRPAEAAFARGYVVYQGALETGDVVSRIAADGIEDFIYLREPLSGSALRYALSLGDQVAGLRLVGNALEFLDGAGAPRLRVASPWLVDAEGRFVDATLAIEGCQVDSDPTAPWGRPTIDPGARDCELVVRWDNEHLAYPILVDPSWTSAGTMSTARYWHCAQALPSGKVLLIGGWTGTAATATSEVWDPATNLFSTTDSMDDSRYEAACASITAGATSYIFVAGGTGSCGVYCSKTERYNETTGLWTATDPMNDPRRNFPLAVLTDGSSTVVASGGVTTGAVATDHSELYDPSTDQWTGTGTLSVARYGHQAVALSAVYDYRVVVYGGRDVSGGFLGSAERYQPFTGLWSSAGGGLTRYWPSLTGYGSDQILVCGGQGGSTSCTERCERYSPGTNSWSAAANMPATTRCYHAGVLLTSGGVLVTGGRASPTGTILSSTYVWTPSTNTWSANTAMSTARYRHTATRYPSSPADRVLVAGGQGSSAVLNSGEYYSP